MGVVRSPLLLRMKSLCAVISSTKGSSKILKEKKEVLEWVSTQIKKVYSVSLAHTQTSEASHDFIVEAQNCVS